ncbi:XrtA/PEP-CTERM system TPR-repeat protein PrsT [Pelomonas sp. KK5]|uniref:XrtA/PEP-CTERM system TPR-repeat protein PrsT n=1 Tax=Pelomonas sp. KK5 TaxID=1855730 RepID=UPI00097C0F53|nr:XrtA/PEP-CTERM system TPR-repeat protein PrsT [Pelomonas sp. KK5]
MSKSISRSLWVVALVLLVGVAALYVHRRNPPVESLIASAQEYLVRNEPKSAMLQLKTALAAKPQSAEARFLLGSALFESGDVTSAEVELRKSIELGYPDESAVPLLARTLLASGQAGKLLLEFGNHSLKDPNAVADLQASLAQAYAEQHAVDLAQVALDRALAAAPANGRARLVQAAFKAEAGDVDGALRLLDGLLASEPGSYEAWQLKGDLLFMARHDAEAAIQAQRQALKIRKDLVGAHASIISIELSQQHKEAAQKQLDELKRVAPVHPRTLFYVADLAFRNGDVKTAREVTQKLLRGAPGNAEVLRLAGSIELQTGGLRTAQDLLGKALKAAPGVVDTRRLLIQTCLRLGDADQAQSLLKPLLAAAQPDAQTYALAAQVYLFAGDATTAEGFFAQAAKLNPGDMHSRTALALAELSKGHAERAYASLAEIASADKDTVADMALISTYLRAGNFEPALKALDNYERKEPRSAMVENLRGLIALTRREVPAAQRHFEQALARDPLYFPAVVSLAEIDLAQGRTEQAQGRFEAVLKKDPKNVRAGLAVAGLRAHAGASRRDVLALMDKAVKQAPTDVKARLVLINAQLAGGEAKAALATAQDGVAAMPDSAELNAALARAQQASGELYQAIATLTRLAEKQGQAPEVFLQLANVQVAAGDQVSARQSFQRALKLRPDLLAAKRGVMMLDIAGGRPKAAMSMARAIQAEPGHEAVGALYVGDIESAQKNWPAAVAAYRDSLKQADMPETAIRLHQALLDAGQSAEADRFAATWVSGHPRDTALLAVLGDMALARQDYASAERHYTAIIALQPNSAGILNNLALAMLRQHKPGALAHAQKANALEPKHPAIMDTLATALAEANQLDKAIELQQRALGLAPDVPKLRFNLATLYIRAGNPGKAKNELQTLRRLGDKYPEQQDVTRLLATL